MSKVEPVPSICCHRAGDIEPVTSVRCHKSDVMAALLSHRSELVDRHLEPAEHSITDRNAARTKNGSNA